MTLLLVWPASLLVFVGDYSLPFLDKADDVEKPKQLLAWAHSSDVEKAAKPFSKSSSCLTALGEYRTHYCHYTLKLREHLFMCAL